MLILEIRLYMIFLELGNGKVSVIIGRSWILLSCFRIKVKYTVFGNEMVVKEDIV